jgi:Kef-type K+ transport system membrane component KefB
MELYYLELVVFCIIYFTRFGFSVKINIWNTINIFLFLEFQFSNIGWCIGLLFLCLLTVFRVIYFSVSTSNSVRLHIATGFCMRCVTEAFR